MRAAKVVQTTAHSGIFSREKPSLLPYDPFDIDGSSDFEVVIAMNFALSITGRAKQ